MTTMQPLPTAAHTDLLHGTSGLLLAYGGATVCLLIGLTRARAPLVRYLAAPLLAVMVLLVGAVFTWLIGMLLPPGLSTGVSAAFDGLFASRLIGDREIIREQISKSRRPNEWLSTTSTSDHHHTEAAVMASEIEQLPDLAGFLKLASRAAWLRVQL